MISGQPPERAESFLRGNGGTQLVEVAGISGLFGFLHLEEATDYRPAAYETARRMYFKERVDYPRPAS
jgi:hypothetical protein